MQQQLKPHIKAIVGLGNPGERYYNNRHSIGFRIIDALVKRLHASWRSDYKLDYANVAIPQDVDTICASSAYLIKPQTYMNDSGHVMPFLTKKGIKSAEILVIHDELEKKFGKATVRFGGSARGHNGLRSIISFIGPDFWRLRFGIGRPERKEDVPDYVLSDFSPEEEQQVDNLIEEAINLIERSVKSNG